MMNRSLDLASSRRHVAAKVDPRKTGGTLVEALAVDM
jgi:hypothetical protein